MKYALVDGIKVEAYQGLKGVCPICGSSLIARCGNRKIHHWAHKGIRNCDSWWEPETEWHRNWKNNFPIEWQEYLMNDSVTNERHVADIRTETELVIEFQHSFINSKEQSSRESFYKNMLWVVDCSRLKRDYTRFQNGRNQFKNTCREGIFQVDFPDECFPTSWLDRDVPVVFDFSNTEQINEQLQFSPALYCLFPSRGHRFSIILELKKDNFIKYILQNKWHLIIDEQLKGMWAPKEVNHSIIEKAAPKLSNFTTYAKPHNWIYDRGAFKRHRRF